MGQDTELVELRKLWEFIRPRGSVACAYCGLIATEKEHVFPKSWIKTTKNLIAIGVVGIQKEIIVPSCQECNLIASDRVFGSFEEKKKFIAGRLLKKYKKFVNCHIWDEEELLTLSGKLKKYIFFSNEIAKVIQRRLKRLRNYE